MSDDFSDPTVWQRIPSLPTSKRFGEKMQSFRRTLVAVLVADGISLTASAMAQSIVSSNSDAAFALRANPARK
jgi:hypothetical protein